MRPQPATPNLADAGTPIQVIADLMGHESLETTRRYIQPGHDDLAAAVERIGGVRNEQHRRSFIAGQGVRRDPIPQQRGQA
jgi:integrase